MIKCLDFQLNLDDFDVSNDYNSENLHHYL